MTLHTSTNAHCKLGWYTHGMDLQITVSENISIQDSLTEFGLAEEHVVNKKLVMVEGKLYICLTGKDGFPFYTSL